MTISSSLNAGVAGLNANASRLATISDNIANSGTYGYKRVETDFESMVLSGRAGGSYSAGGVRSDSSRMVDQSGSLVSTSNATDLAVKGGGFIPVTSAASVDAGGASPDLRFTTTGSFSADAQGYLRTASGFNLLGVAANPDGTIPQFSRQTGANLEPVRIDTNALSAEPTTRMSVSANLPATYDGTDPQSMSAQYIDTLGRSRDLELQFTPDGGTANTWDVTATALADDGTALGTANATLTFDASSENGGTVDSLTSPSGDVVDGRLRVPAEGDQTISVDLAAMTQLSNTFTPGQISSDGAAAGNIVSTEVDETGLLKANYDSGVTRTLYQIPLAEIANANAMTALDGQTYRTNGESGGFALWDAGSGPTGGIAGYAREGSTTDVAGELTDLIQTQRAYSSNAKVIQTVDEMLQETTNIKR